MELLDNKCDTLDYGSLYVTLCFVLCRFDFDVFIFVFCV